MRMQSSPCWGRHKISSEDWLGLVQRTHFTILSYILVANRHPLNYTFKKTSWRQVKKISTGFLLRGKDIPPENMLIIEETSESKAKTMFVMKWDLCQYLSHWFCWAKESFQQEGLQWKHISQPYSLFSQIC